MAVNRTKVLEAAQKFLSKGQFEKAIAEYQKLVAEDPRDVRTLLKIGDLHTRRNKPKDAIEVYQRVAELYAKQGFFLKAVAVYKQILKLEPGHIESSQRLANMYEELGLTNDALSTYEQVADAFAAEGNVERALATMTRMVDLDPQNIAVRIKYAEALSRAGKTREAAVAFAAGAQLLKEQGRMDDYVRVVERQFFHDSENLELARELSSLYLTREDPKRALAKLQVCFKADPRDVQTLEMLAEAFRQLGQIPKTVSVLKEIARLHGEFGSADARRRTLQRVLDLDPSDAEAREALAGEPPAKAPPAPPPKAPSTSSSSSSGSRSHAMPPPPAPAAAADDDEAEEVELEMVEEDDDDAIEIVAEDDEDAEVLIVDDDSPSTDDSPPADEKSPEALLEEAEDLEALEDYEGAERVLQQLLARNRDHELAHERLKDLYLATDRRVEAVRELLWLSDFCMERDMARAVQHAQAAYDLAPHAEATKNRLRMLGVDIAPAEPPKPAERAEPSRPDAQAPAAPDAAEDELNAILPALDGAEPAQARSDEEQPPQGTEDSSQASPLDAELSPDEFDAPVPSPRGPLDPQVLALLEEPLHPEDFEGPAEPPVADDDVAALLDAPISPDEFDAPPPPRNRVSSLPPNAEALLEAPLPVEEFDRADSDGGVPDDFGLSDPRFETSGMMEVDALPQPRKPKGAAPAEWILEEDDDSPSMEFAEIGTDEVDLTEYSAQAAGDAPKPAEAAEPPPEAPLRTTVRPDAAEEEQGPFSTEEMELEPAEAPALAFDESDDFQELPPDSTVPGAPIPDLLLQARPDARIPEPTNDAPSAPEPEPRAVLADSEPPQDDVSTEQEAVLESPSFEAVAAEPDAGSVHEYVTTPAPDGVRAKSPDASAHEHVTAPAPATSSATAPQPATDEEIVSPEIEEVLDEADFFASQGLMDEALEVVQEAILIYPSSKALRARLLEYEAKADAQEEEEEARAAELADDSFDIAEQLANELAEVPGPGSSEEMIDVESVFAQFKKGVAAQISPDDSETHFDLGIAYKEMGLLEDAIQEFEIAAKNPKRACTALTMVGMCHLEKGNAQEAVAYFERALHTEHRSPAEELALLYEVGNAQELLGNETSALQFFERVAGTDRSFRGVSARVDALKKRGAASAPP